MSDLPPPPEDLPPPPPPPPGPGSLPPPPFSSEPPPGYVAYGQHRGSHAVFAGFWIRFLAAFLDGLIVGIPLAILGAMTGATDVDRTDAFGNETDSTDFRFFWGWNGAAPTWWNLLTNIVGAAYYGMLEGGATGQTLGKRICGIRVVDASTGQAGIGLGRGVGRYFARILSAVVLLLGYLWMLWDPRKQTWHDKLVSTVVVKG